MEVTVPGDKSLSQRALLFAALADGRSRLRGSLDSGDPRSTAAVLRQLGVDVPPVRSDEMIVQGVGLRGLAEPSAGAELDCGNSGTCARLLMGVLAGQAGAFTLTGDASLRSRPMERVTRPLGQMGARFEALDQPGRLPLRVRGGELTGITYAPPMASAQVKSAILLAGLTGSVPVRVREPARSRDHTERLLSHLGVPVTSEEAEDGWWVSLTDPPPSIDPLDLFVPGDFSSAAFLVALALLGGARDPLEIRDVGLNPTRTGALEVLARMGGVVRVEFAPSGRGQEPIGTVIAERSDLSGCEIGGSEIAGLIDELPILAVVAARAHGRTRITGAGELRVKESDRIRALAENLRAIGVKAEELDDGLEIEGTQRPLSGRVEARHDHRIAMAFGILDALPGNRVEVDDPGVADVSFPGFWEFLGRIGRGASAHRPPREGGSGASRAPVVTIDGPAGSGKSSTAREVAERLGFRHLDSGALYRAITYALLEDGVPVDEWPSLTVTDLDRYPIRLDPKPGGFELSLAGRPLGPELRAATVTERVSLAARVPAVRAWLLDQQRRAGGPGGLVADGRDMGSVVFPDAEVKVFLTADLRERARRRILQDTGREPDARAVEAEASRIAARDRTDAEREASPLRRPVGAVVLDTTSLTMDEQVAHVVGLVESLERPDR